MYVFILYEYIPQICNIERTLKKERVRRTCVVFRINYSKYICILNTFKIHLFESIKFSIYFECILKVFYFLKKITFPVPIILIKDNVFFIIFPSGSNVSCPLNQTRQTNIDCYLCSIK